MSKKKLNFARIPSIMDLPDLLEIQKKSYAEFLQQSVTPEKRKYTGLQAAFKDIFPIANSTGTLSLEYVNYILDTPVYNENECIEKDMTYASPLKAKIRLIIKDAEAKNKVKEVTEQEIFICELPLMTTTGSFIINGAQRVVVSQLHRSPGVIFEEDENNAISSYGKKLYTARIIPYRGAWVEFEFDINNALFVRINKKRKFPVTTFLRVLGYETDEKILNLFYENEEIKVRDSQESQDRLIGSYLASDVVNPKTGEILLDAAKEITKELYDLLMKEKVEKVKIVKIDPQINNVTILNTIKKDPIKSNRDVAMEIFKKLRPFDFLGTEMAQNYLQELLFTNPKKYDLGKVGRYKLNKKLHLDIADSKRTLTVQDIIETIKYVIDLNNGISELKDSHGKIVARRIIDDIDHLGNRRIRSVGELLENQIRIGLSHMERLVREKMNIKDLENITPRDLINTSPIVAVIRKFYGSSQLSQFMDQTNPLAELTHKRRLSALGPGGLNRKRAGFEVRDVHPTHYGRICPIETPEGPNIGLITSLSTYAKVNEYGFLETPYRKVKDGKATSEIEYFTADDEDEVVVAQANTLMEEKTGKILDAQVLTRLRDIFPLLPPSEIAYMDVSPKQLVSIAAALIPFLEHDDANRALMGSNMQRQAVPLLFPERPLVGTGMEQKIAVDSGAVILAKRDGIVRFADSEKIIIWGEDSGKSKDNGANGDIDIYYLKKFIRTNQDTCVNQRPIVQAGDRVSKGTIIADGAATDGGDLALGRNLLVGFMTWEGYNFEDAILINERLLKEDVFTSVHITEFEIEARDLKLRAEEITRDIPNVGEDTLRNLDERGIIRIGAEVRPGDILVGKVTPKGETQVTPEERLLRVIFGEKAEEVRDASLYVPPGVDGKVIGVKVFSRKEKGRTKATEKREIERINKEFQAVVSKIKSDAKKEAERVKNELAASLKGQSKGASKLKAEAKEKTEFFERMTLIMIEQARREKNMAIDRYKKGDELSVEVNKLVKVYIASKRRISVGDKVAGRHGNKGVISKVLPQEDMPYLADGTPLDIILNPLSVPSRMNIGQILEAELGWGASKLGCVAVTPVFDGAKEAEIQDMLERAGLPRDSRVTLYDGRTGETFHEKVTVGQVYILKLAHLVDDKMHARSIGPYALITRQPLGGKAQFGGQRFGEMEVWAIEGYGAAYTLQEFLTVKSDDISGRTRMYEAIIKGETPPPPGTPESFKVLIKELQGLGLNVELLKK
ncbi:MAG: DNA-directed RNA polymerase subunit beta [bacterium]|nr:DNA-directed RNA polymerase subunit beta [bacterium]